MSKWLICTELMGNWLKPASNGGWKMNILVTSISRKVPLLLAVKAAGRKLGREVTVTGADLDPACPGRYLSRFFWLMPPLFPTAGGGGLLRTAKTRNHLCHPHP